MRLFRLELPLGHFIAGSALVVGLATPGAADRPSVKAPPHTRSIVACDPDRSQCGIAVVSFPSGVPAVVPVAEPGVMVANQFWPNIATARRIIDSVKAGRDAETALNEALGDDPDPTWRQLGVAALDATSPSGVSVANWTGSAGPLYLPEVCSQKGATYSVQAGLQTSTEVCAVMAAAFERTPGLLARRLLAALKAGAAVGDVRGEYSATVRVISDAWDFAFMTPWVVAADVVRSGNWQADTELAVDEWLAEWWSPGDTADLVGVTREKTRKIQKILRALAYYRGPAHGSWTPETEEALKAWELVQLGWEKPTVESGGTRYIEEAVAGYLILGWPRGVLVRNPNAGD